MVVGGWKMRAPYPDFVNRHRHTSTLSIRSRNMVAFPYSDLWIYILFSEIDLIILFVNGAFKYGWCRVQYSAEFNSITRRWRNGAHDETGGSWVGEKLQQMHIETYFVYCNSRKQTKKLEFCQCAKIKMLLMRVPRNQVLGIGSGRRPEPGPFKWMVPASRSVFSNNSPKWCTRVLFNLSGQIGRYKSGH